MKSKNLLLLLFVCLSSSTMFSQLNEGSINGNVQILWQQYNEDSLIGAIQPPEKTAMNAFGNLIYTKGDFTAGLRFESYLPALNGYPGGFEGTGIGYRYARYKRQNFDITIGNFYEQFGSGLALRTYEERNIGIDNALDGFRMIYRPFAGVTVKGVYGRQRVAFDSGIVNSEGAVRGVDGEVFLNDLFPDKLGENKTKITLGGSFVSKFQSGSVIAKDSLLLQLPQNVGNYGGRIGIIRNGLTFSAEYIEKINDPSVDNGFIYKNGKGILLEAGYSKKGFGIVAAAKHIDNMSYRSDRNSILLQAPINYIPAITKQHTYNLAATLYPYATLINGESSYMAEIFYKVKKDTPLGGKYGMNITANYAAANSIDTTSLAGNDGTVYGYKTNSFGFGTTKFVRDFNIQFSKKINKKLKLKYTFFDLEFNTRATIVTLDFLGTIYANIHVLEAQYKIKPKNSIRVEVQTLFTDQDKKDWFTFLAEYNFSPHWFFSVINQYNYGNDDPEQRIHYLFGTMGYINGSNRISIGVGKRREGIFCVGGVCRAVPASNGLELTITSSF